MKRTITRVPKGFSDLRVKVGEMKGELNMLKILVVGIFIAMGGQIWQAKVEFKELKDEISKIKEQKSAPTIVKN